MIHSPTLRSRLQLGFSWNLVGALFNQGSTVAVNIMVANILGRQGFGEYAMIQSTIVTLSAIAQMGTGITAAKHVAEFRSVDKDKTGRILGLCSIVSALQAVAASLALLVAAPWVAGSVLKAPLLSPELMIASAVVLFSAMNFYQMGALSGLESYRTLGLAGVINGCLYLGICCAATWLWGLQGALAGLAASAIIQWVILRRALRVERLSQGIAIHYRNVWQEHAVITKFAIPAAISGLSTLPSLWLANTFLVRQPDGYSQMALYSAANNLRVMIVFLPGVLDNVCTSLLNNQKGINNQVGFRRLFWANVAITGTIVLVGAVVVIVFGPQLLRIFGKDFTGGYGILCILMLSTVFEALGVAFYQTIRAQARMWLSLTAVCLPRDLSMVILSFLMVPIYGAAGLAISYTVCHALGFIIVVFINYLLASSRRTLPYCEIS